MLQPTASLVRDSSVSQNGVATAGVPPWLSLGVRRRRARGVARRFSFELVYAADSVSVAIDTLNSLLPTGRRSRARVPVADLGGLTPDTPVFAELSLLFPADEAVRGFYPLDDMRPEWTDEGIECLPVGAIDLAIRVGVSYALLTFTARTNGMSDLFQDSLAVWRQFADLLRTSGGLGGLFHGAVPRGVGSYPLLPDGREAVELDFCDFVLEERDLYWHIDVDRYAAAILQAPRVAGRPRNFLG
jgi:hypothetical protein